MTRLRSVVCVAGALLAHISPALAEQPAPPPHCVADVVPSLGQTIPANAPALAIVDRGTPGVDVAIALGAATPPVTLDLTPDAKLARTRLLAPRAPLQPGAQYVIDLDLSCPNGQPSSWYRTPPLPTSFTFEAGPEVPLPTRIGDVTFRRAPPEKVTGGTVLVIKPTPELLAYLPLTMWSIKASDSVYELPYGSKAAKDGEIELEFFGYCRGQAQTMLLDLTVQAHVAGASTDPAPISLAVPLECTAPYRGGGCAVSADAASSGAAPLLALLWVLGMRGSRRRRAPVTESAARA